jgi:hypothetical protein
LQTPNYILAVAQTYYPESTPEQRQRFVEFRLKRQEILSREPEPLQLHFILGELVLRRVIGDPSVMLEQLEALVNNITHDMHNVTIQIAPGSLTTRGAIGGPFVILSYADPEDDLVYLEGRSGAEYLRGEADLDHYRSMFDDLARSALDRDASLAMIEEAIKKLS